MVPNSNGGWDVKKPDAERSSGHFATQKQAIDRANQIIDSVGGGEVTVHGRYGRIRRLRHAAGGNDPNPPKDEK